MPSYSREQLLYGDCCLSEALFFCRWKALKGKELEFSKTSLLAKITQGCVSHCCATPHCIYIFFSRSLCNGSSSKTSIYAPIQGVLKETELSN